MPGHPHDVGQRRLPQRRSCVLSRRRGVGKQSYAFLAYFPRVRNIDMARSGPLGECITVKRRLNGSDFAREDCTFLDQCIERRLPSARNSPKNQPSPLVLSSPFLLPTSVHSGPPQLSTH